MPPLDWLRTFVAVHRAGSISAAARRRHLTQPAVSQQLAALESLVGVPLFRRTAKGTVPTARGQDLYLQVFDALDRLEHVGRGLGGRDGTPGEGASPSVRLGAPMDYFHAFALERLHTANLALVVRGGAEPELLSMLEEGALDAVVTTRRPTARGLQYRPLASKRYVLIGPAALVPPPAELPPGELARWLNAQPWVSYSLELPTTRRLWQQHLGARFEARLALVVPDLRAVLRAVELGYGLSLLPEFLCREALAQGRVRLVWPPVCGLLRGERWLLAFREVDADRAGLRVLGDALDGRQQAAPAERS